MDLLQQGQVCCAVEKDGLSGLADLPPRDWDDVGNYFGKYLYIDDSDFNNVRVALGNSGVIGFDNTRRVRIVSFFVRLVASSQSREQIALYTDQPILNYVLHKTRTGNFELLNKYCRLTRSLESVPPDGRRGLVHFHLIADAKTKAAMMRSYLSLVSS